MEFRRLGNSGLQVSTIGVGCNNFSARCDFEASRSVVHKALDLGITLFDTSDSYGRGGSGGLSRANSRSSARRRRARHQVQLADGRRPIDERGVPPLHHASGRGQFAASANGLDRSLSIAFPRSRNTDRGDIAGPRRSRSSRQSALYRMFESRRLAGSRGGLDVAPERPRRFRHLSKPV